jgi:hypothetical protein
MAMIDSDKKVELLKQLLSRIGLELRTIMPTVTGSFTDPDVRDAIVRAEKLSRYAESFVGAGREGLLVAFARADRKADVQSECFVVAGSKAGTGPLVVISKARFLEERPFGFGRKDIIYTTDSPRKSP